MDLRLLGPIEARLGDRTLHLGARKQRAVLAMLGLQANRTVSIDRLAEGLWGEAPPPSAPKMVQLYVSQLRRALDGNGAAIVTHGRGYELRLAAGEVDTTRFEELVEEGRAREALALWRGEPLADVADEPFAAAEIRRLEELRLRAHELAIDADLAAGRHADVIGELEALVAAHPLRERLQGQLLLALYRSGRQAEALDAYRHARHELVEQIGVEPGAELRRLQQAILEQDPALDLRGAEAAAPPPPTRAPPQRRGRRSPLVVAAVLAAAAGLIAFGVSRVTAPDRLGRIDENAVGLIDPGSGRITAQYAVGRGPGAVVAGGGSVWVANTLGGTVSRIEQKKPHQVTSIDVGGEPTALAFGAGSLWVANGEDRMVAQLDPGTNRVVRELPVGNASRAIAAGSGALWVASAIDRAVRRIDLDRPALSRSIDVRATPTAIAAGAGAIWVASEESGTVTRIDPRTGALKAIPVGNGPSAVAVGEGAVWVTNRADDTVSRIDPRTNAVSWAIGVGGDPTAIAAGDGAVWVAGGSAGTVTRLDPGARPKIVRTVEVESTAAAVAIADGSVWTAAAAPPSSHRGGTLRVVSPDPPVPIDWLNPESYFYAPLQVLSLAYDGLVAYRRIGGAAGTTLVGALAADVPAPSRDGRTYVFTLRPGVRYSDGTPVRSEDFRASIERFLAAKQRDFPAFYDGIVGAARCLRRPARCDLSAGIDSDRRARTITVHLTRPDAEFLHKLTLPFAYVVPADTPIRRTGDRVLPGTGPYRIAAWETGRGGHLVRNPHFRSWSPQDRPAGFADRIEVAVRRQNEVGKQVPRVQSGAADVVVVANPFKPLFPPARLAALAVDSPGQLYTHAEASLGYMFLNVLAPPFDDIRVRRAVNYATDRARVVELEGGGELATATCQILPVGFPGYVPYCPYTARSGPGRGWTAPDIERARALIAASGTAGQRIVVHVPDFKLHLGRYFARLLDELGYRASVRIPDGEYFEAMRDPRTRAQIGFGGYSADYAAPSTFIQPNFTCASQTARQPDNTSYFCNHELARRVELALAAEGSDATKRWTTIDHELADRAPAVPLTNRRSAVLVSERVGNVQHQLQGYTLLDQMWVR